MNAGFGLLGKTMLGMALLSSVAVPGWAQTPPSPPPVAGIDFGDDSGDWANDGECDDPRFTGEGMADELVEADRMKDATDCRTALEAGTISLVEENTSDEDTETAPASSRDIDFGDDSGDWANDGECDDPRFSGTGSAAELLDADRMKDATDCKAALDAGTVTFVGDDAAGSTATARDDIDYGDDTSQWANDGECDDPRFSGALVARKLLDEDRGHDATDCKAAIAAGASFTGGTTDGSGATLPPFDFGSDMSRYANDGECDDPRFTGEGTDKKLLGDDLAADATDCKALLDEGKVTIRKVYTPEYQAGAPYSSEGVEFGDNTSSYADDQVCDDPRFEGPGTAGVLLDSDNGHDSADCKANYENGTVTLREDA